MAKRPEIKKVTENINRLGLDAAKEMTEQLNSNVSKKEKIDNEQQEKLNSKDRVKITTMINPTLRDELKVIAMKKHTNFSDILEDAIKLYLKK